MISHRKTNTICKKSKIAQHVYIRYTKISLRSDSLILWPSWVIPLYCPLLLGNVGNVSLSSREWFQMEPGEKPLDTPDPTWRGFADRIMLNITTPDSKGRCHYKQLFHKLLFTPITKPPLLRNRDWVWRQWFTLYVTGILLPNILPDLQLSCEKMMEKFHQI